MKPAAWELRKGKTDRVLVTLTDNPEYAHNWKCFGEEAVELFTADQFEHAPEIPDGWVFLSADFSMQANGRSEYGGAMLMRNKHSRHKWHTLSDEDKEKVPLYASGSGKTLQEAIAAASLKAIKYGPIDQTQP